MNVEGKYCLKQFVRIIVVVVAVSFYPCTVPAAAMPVTVYYFHSTQRCPDCLEIERLTGEILQENFHQELASGQLSWRPLNVDLPENTHFIFDYDLAANQLVVVRERPGSKNSWHKLAQTWQEIQEPERFGSKLVQMVQQALQSAY